MDQREGTKTLFDRLASFENVYLAARRIRDPRVRDLTRTIIARGNPQPPPEAYFPGDELLTPFARRKGLPIGNPTSLGECVPGPVGRPRLYPLRGRFPGVGRNAPGGFGGGVREWRD